jgi:hypothetical protein
MHDTCYQDLARLGDTLDARGDIDSIAVQSPRRCRENIPGIDADTKPHLSLWRQTLAEHCNLLLKADGTGNSRHHTIEEHQNAVAGNVGNPTVRPDGFPLNNGKAGVKEPRCSHLIAFDQTRVLRHISRQDRVNTTAVASRHRCLVIGARSEFELKRNAICYLDHIAAA